MRLTSVNEVLVENGEPVNFNEFIYFLKFQSRDKSENNHFDQFGL